MAYDAKLRILEKCQALLTEKCWPQISNRDLTSLAEVEEHLRAGCSIIGLRINIEIGDLVYR